MIRRVRVRIAYVFEKTSTHGQEAVLASARVDLAALTTQIKTLPDAWTFDGVEAKITEAHPHADGQTITYSIEGALCFLRDMDKPSRDLAIDTATDYAYALERQITPPRGWVSYCVFGEVVAVFPAKEVR